MNPSINELHESQYSYTDRSRRKLEFLQHAPSSHCCPTGPLVKVIVKGMGILKRKEKQDMWRAPNEEGD